MGQIVGGAAKPKRCNLNKLSQLGTPAAGEHILVSSNNSMNAAGQGNFDCYIVGDGTTLAEALPRKNITDYTQPMNTVTGYIKNNGSVSLLGKNNRVSWYSIPPRTKVKIQSACSEVILAKCDSVGQMTGLTPLFQGNGTNLLNFTMYFEDATIIALTYIVTLNWHIYIEQDINAFDAVIDGKNLLNIFEDNNVIANVGLMNKNTPFSTTTNFAVSYTNGLTNQRCIRLNGGANQGISFSAVSGHKYAIIESVRCDAFTPYATSTANGYTGKGGAAIIFSNPTTNSTDNIIRVKDEALSENAVFYAPCIADKYYRTFILFADAQSTGTQYVNFGTRKAIDGNISGTFYMDNAFIIDLSESFGSEIPSYNQFVKLFGDYLKLYTSQTFINDGYSDKEIKTAFIDAINRKASQIGMTNSHFSNPGGYDETENYFTANDGLKMLCAASKTGNFFELSSIPSYSINIYGSDERTITTDSTYKSSTQVNLLSPYTIIAGKTGTLQDDAHVHDGVNMNTANVGLVVKSPNDGALLAGVVVLPLTKQSGSWKTQSGQSSPYNDRYSVLKQLFDLLEQHRGGVDVTEAVNNLQCGYAAACVVPPYIDTSSAISLISKNGDIKCYPASMTKLMTLLTLSDNFEANNKIIIYGSDVIGGSGINVKMGDVLYGNDAIIGLMLPSSNTIASALASSYGHKYLGMGLRKT